MYTTRTYQGSTICVNISLCGPSEKESAVILFPVKSNRKEKGKIGKKKKLGQERLWCGKKRYIIAHLIHSSENYKDW